MSNLFKHFFDSDESIPLSKIVLSLFGIVILRAFFENFSSPNPADYFFSWKDTYLEFPLYYFSVFLSFGLLIYFFTKKSLNKILNFEIKIFLFALFPPLIDLVVTNGKGLPMAYIVTEPQNFFSAFFKTLNPFGFLGITPGIHFAAYFILLFISLFIYKETKSKLKSVLSIVVGYSLLFSYAIIPSLMALPQFVQNDTLPATAAYESTLKRSWIVTTDEQTKGILEALQPFDAREFQNEVTTQIFFLSIILQLIIFLYIFKPTFFTAIKNDFRASRILYWFVVASIGITINQRLFGNVNFSNTINIISLLLFFTLIALNIWLAVTINDFEDVTIDEISNPDRPLAKKVVSETEWKNFQAALVVLVIFGNAIMNHAVGFLLILAQMCYYLYSARPLRLKKHFFTSSILIGIASVAIAMSGFYLVSSDQHFSAFPTQAVFIIGISYAILSNFKDIKDFKGDKHENIRTIPVVFGLKRSKQIIAALFSLVIISVPLMMDAYSLMPFSLCASIFLFYLFTKKEYQEKYILLTFFLYMLALYISL